VLALPTTPLITSTRHMLALVALTALAGAPKVQVQEFFMST